MSDSSKFNESITQIIQKLIAKIKIVAKTGVNVIQK